MATEPRAALSRRRLRSALRNLRTSVNKTQKEVAKALDWSEAKILRIEQGRVGISITDLRALLGQYQVNDEAQVEAMIKLAREGRGKTHSQAYSDIYPGSFINYLEEEEAALVIRQYEPSVIPGPLQTEEYARAVLSRYAGTEESRQTIERRVEARLARSQMIQEAGAPQAYYVMDEAAVRRQTGGLNSDGSVLTRQLNHLKKLSVKSNIHIQIVPFSKGYYRASGASFVVLEFEDAADPNLLYREDVNGDILTREETRVTENYLNMFNEAENLATKPDELVAAIDAIVASFTDWEKRLGS